MDGGDKVTPMAHQQPTQEVVRTHSVSEKEHHVDSQTRWKWSNDLGLWSCFRIGSETDLKTISL